MMKIRHKISLLLAGAVIALSGCSGQETAVTDTSHKQITVWTTDSTREITQKMLDKWLAGQTEWNNKYTITVNTMETGEIVTQFLTDSEKGADVFNFAQDQLTRLIAVNAISAPGGVFLDNILANNDEGSINAATYNGKVYAYPETSDNGYIMYYDTSVISDTSTLEGILDQCSAAGKKFYYDINNGWYNVSFFFGTGADCGYECNDDGVFTSAYCTYNSAAGMKAFKAMLSLVSDPSYAQSTGADAYMFNPDGGNAAVIVSVPSEGTKAKEYLGENFGAAKLPTFTVDGETFRMSGFKGYKLIGVKPQSDSDTAVFCHKIADYLSGEEMQLARYEADGWGPSNLKAKQNEKVRSDKTLTALAEQFNYCKDQGQFPNVYWDLTKAFGMDINAGKYKNANEAQLQAALDDLTAEIIKAR